MSRVHHDLSILYMPDEEPKSKLCKAAMYIEVKQFEEACAIYHEMYHGMEELELIYQPYVLNNQGL